jgi:cytochrome c peroxidase
MRRVSHNAEHSTWDFGVVWLGILLISQVSALSVNSAHGTDTSDHLQLLKKYVRPASIPSPVDNASTSERVVLGRALFFDPRLSASNWISCGTCHNPALSWGDGLAKGLGHGMKQLGRRTPTVLNLAWAPALFWDGRAGTLEEQALGPIKAPGEMNLPVQKMIEKIDTIAAYKPHFDKAYPHEAINEKTVAKAIAAFERTLVSGKAPFDEWMAGDESAISEPAKRGFVLFNTKGNCVQCHSGWRFTDDSFHDIGVTGADRGRGAMFKNVQAVQFAFKTPTLRNVDHRAPYMHNGTEKTLEDVIELYNGGGRVKRPSLTTLIKPLNFTAQEKHGLVAFLKTLTGKDTPVEFPVLPR